MQNTEIFCIMLMDVRPSLMKGENTIVEQITLLGVPIPQ